MSFEKVNCGQREFTLLIEINGFSRMAVLAGFNLDEDDDLSVTTDQVNFALSRAVTPNQNLHPALAKVLGRRPLASVAQPTVPERPQNGRFWNKIGRHGSARHAKRPFDLRPFRTHGAG